MEPLDEEIKSVTQFLGFITDEKFMERLTKLAIEDECPEYKVKDVLINNWNLNDGVLSINATVSIDSPSEHIMINLSSYKEENNV